MLREANSGWSSWKRSARIAVQSSRGQQRCVFAAAALTILLVTIELVILLVTGAEWRQLTSDPNGLAGQPWYFGFMEIASSLTLAAAAGIALFTTGLIEGSARRFIVAAGVFTLLLSLDDIYMLHEAISERSIYLLYGGYVLLLLVFNRDYLLRTPVVMAAAAVSCLVAAVVVDTATDWRFVNLKGAEEVLELFAFCLWSAYLVTCSRRAIMEGQAAARVVR